MITFTVVAAPSCVLRAAVLACVPYRSQKVFVFTVEGTPQVASVARIVTLVLPVVVTVALVLTIVIIVSLVLTIVIIVSLVLTIVFLVLTIVITVGLVLVVPATSIGVCSC